MTLEFIMRVFVLILASIFCFQANALTTDKKMYIGLGVTAAAIIAAGVGWYIYDTNKNKERMFPPQPRSDADRQVDQNLASIKHSSDQNTKKRLEKTEAAYKKFVKELVNTDGKIAPKDKFKYESALLKHGKTFFYGFSDPSRTQASTNSLAAIIGSVATDFNFDKNKERLTEFLTNAAAIYNKNFSNI